MDAQKFKGKHRLINIPASGDYDNNLKYGRFEEKSGNGKYVVVFANCNDEGRPVIVEGHTVWKSHHGYLPGDLFGLMYFLAFMFFVYFIMLLWYGITMKIYEDANIPIQTWIFGTIAMGCLELFFRTGDLFVWNEDGTRFWIAYYVGEYSLARDTEKSSRSLNPFLLFCCARRSYCGSPEKGYQSLSDSYGISGLGSRP